MQRILAPIAIGLGLATLLSLAPISAAPVVPPRDAEKIGRLIWKNECAGTVAGLTSWNEGENFASLGIGHFIWFPKGVKERFTETFPLYVKYCRKRGVPLPEILLREERCPWKSRKQFLASTDSPAMRELRFFLKESIPAQTDFLALRLDESLPKMLAAAADADARTRVRARFDLLRRTSSGLYALMDYVNFKGEGISPSERYAGQGWGLLQVLETMRDPASAEVAPAEFARAAKAVLARRIANSPPARGENRWRAGWFNRIDTYAGLVNREL